MRNCRDITYCYEPDHEHGDLVIAKGLAPASTVACEAQATSDAHRMCIVLVPLYEVPLSPFRFRGSAAGSAAKPAPAAAAAAQPLAATAVAEAEGAEPIAEGEAEPKGRDVPAEPIAEEEVIWNESDALPEPKGRDVPAEPIAEEEVSSSDCDCLLYTSPSPRD